jgi:hypothetical protein
MILDHIENIQIYPGITPIANFHSILQLKEGIFMAYNHMNHLQLNYYRLKHPEKSNEEIELINKSKFSMDGTSNQIDAQAVNLYHWYSINLINYAKCCGLIQFLNTKMVLPEYIAQNKDLLKELREEQNKYINQIPDLEPVKHFRNKAGAHLAFTDPKPDDNVATLLESMSIIPTYLNDKITIGALKRQRGKHVSSFADYQWSLTDNFDSLIPRYFKNDFG